MKKNIFLLAMALFCGLVQGMAQQNSDAQYSKPLRQVLSEIEQRFAIKIRYPDSMVQNKTVPYADWRYRTDADATLDNVLRPLDMKVNKESPTSYKLKYYEYYRWPVEEGKQKLDYLSSLYNDVPSWEKRKQTLKQCLAEALRLSPLPAKPASASIITNKRKMGDYTIENIAIETLPGLYVSGSIYRPAKFKGKIPVVLCPDGHWEKCRYRPDCQYRCATLARLGCIAVSYDLFAWGESLLQFNSEDHRRSLAQTIQALDAIRLLDYMLSLKEADTSRVAISGGSGGGSQTILITALDDRIKLSAPIVSLSCYMYGGCPCESGMPIHFCGGGTDNPEIAAMAAPRPMLIVSDGKDWTDHVPEIELPYLQKMYGYYGRPDNVKDVHLPTEGHDFGINKRTPLYEFIAEHFNLDIKKIKDISGKIDEAPVTIEEEPAMYVFGNKGEKLPANAIHGFDNLQRLFDGLTQPAVVRPELVEGPTNHPLPAQRYKVAVVDLMILKRQKLGAFELTKTIGADGVEIDMGGLGTRETFDNSLAIDSIRQQFLDKAQALHLEISSLAMTGFYAQSFANRPTAVKAVEDCINTMKQMNVKVGFLPLGVNGDLVKNPELRPAIVERLKEVGKYAQQAGVVIAIETALPAADEVKLLKDIGSPAIKICFNFSNPLAGGRDLYKELETLGRDHIAEIHCTNKDGVWLQNDPQIDMKKIKEILDKMKWSGWLVIERSRDASDARNVKKNFGANTTYVKSIFQSPANN